MVAETGDGKRCLGVAARHCLAGGVAGVQLGMNRILLIVAAVCFGLAALSAFSDAIDVNELGFVALGLLAYAWPRCWPPRPHRQQREPAAGAAVTSAADLMVSRHKIRPNWLSTLMSTFRWERLRDRA